MKIQETKQMSTLTTTKKALLMATFTIAFSITPTLQSEARADPLDKSSPKIAHGMYRDRGKSSPKIAHGMYRDRGKSSPKIAHGMVPDRPSVSHPYEDNSWDWLFRMLGF